MSNSSITPLTGACLPPFLDVSLFPSTGGFIDARLCLQAQELPGQPTCCLPCPTTNWIYPDSLKTYNVVAEWLNVLGLLLLLFMLFSYLILPAAKTRKHYLSTCLIISIMMICIGFIIPLVSRPEQCFNEITPRDQYSSLECAWSGGFLCLGGLTTTMWITIRAVSMNMQICWDIVPGRKFLYISQVLGWGIPVILFIPMMIVTGVSFRFGNACHVNHQNALGVFWIPLFIMVAIASASQLYTFGYCLRVYLSNLWGGDAPAHSTNNSSGLPSYNASLRAQTTRAVFQRLKKVLFLQWRGLGIVTIILVDVIFFSIVFVHVDKLADDALTDTQRVYPWILCLVAHPEDKDYCSNLVNSWLINVETIEAVLFLFALAGLQCFLMLTRPTFFSAWYDLFRQRFAKRQDFVSLDAQSQFAMQGEDKAGSHRYEHTTAFEMQKPRDRASSEDTGPRSMLQLDTKSPTVTSSLGSPEEAYKSPSGAFYGRAPGTSPPVDSYPSPPPVAHVTGMQRETDYSAAQQRQKMEERSYNAPGRSFSATRTPSRRDSLGRYESGESNNRGGLGLHPPSESQEDLTLQHRRGDGLL